MCAGSHEESGIACLLQDPLIRLVMKSDGVTEQDMLAVMDHLQRSLTAREDRMSSVEQKQLANRGAIQ
jgi:hypothetical protein